MAILSPFTIIRSIAGFNIALAFMLLTNPQQLGDQNLVFILGEAMGLQHLPSSALSNPQSTAMIPFLALLLIYISITDFLSAGLPEVLGLHYWSNQAPIRSTLFFLISGYVGLGGSKFGSMGTVTNYNRFAKGSGSILEGLQGMRNSFVFSWCFLMLMGWFWVYLSLRDEQTRVAEKERDRIRMEANTL